MTVMNVTFKIRRDTSAKWIEFNPTLQSGELGIDTTLNKVKIGNGSSLWSNLSYLHVTPTELSNMLASANTYTDQAIAGLSNSLSGSYVLVTDVGQPDGVASLGSDRKIPDSEIPSTITRDSELSSAVATAVSNLVGAAPALLNTLSELSDALNDNPDFGTQIAAQIAALTATVNSFDIRITSLELGI